MHFRIVTRGNNPNLVLANCKHALKVLRSSGLPATRYRVDVATDKHMETMAEVPEVEEIVVPGDYAPPGGCKYKARALNYAANASSSLHHDWIIHLDEETRFDVDTVENIFAHCVKQEQAVARGESSFPSIGQGVIYYNTATIDNYLTTLADYIRVSDDYAKFQLQYKMFRMPLVGMHGSFVVCQTSLERDVGWDWGMVGSITEDTYFAMYLAAMGVRIDWCGGKMYEQSPFTCADFAKQRARWFSGLWLCVLTKTLPLWQRAFLGMHLVSWSICPILTFVTWLNLLVVFPRTEAFVYLMSFVFAIPFFSYALGFVLGSSPAQFKHGIVEWGLLLVLHVSLIPVYTIMETWGVARGIFDRSTYTGFHIVQKEKAVDASPPVVGAENAGEQPPAGQTGAGDEQAPGQDLPSCMLGIVEPACLLATGPISSPDVSEFDCRDEHMAHWRHIINVDWDHLDLMNETCQRDGDGSKLVPLPPALVSSARFVREIAAASGVDEICVAVTLVAVTLDRYVRSGEILIGVALADEPRAQEPLEGGRRLEVVPVLVAVKDQTFEQVLRGVSAALAVGRAKRSGIAIEDLVAVAHRTPLFHVVVSMEEPRAIDEVANAHSEVADMRFSFELQPDNEMYLAIWYRATKFCASSVQRVQTQVAIIAEAVGGAPPGQRASCLKMMSEEELQHVTHKWANGAGPAVAHAETLAELLETALASAVQTKLAIENPQQGLKLTYKQLDAATAGLARHLRERHGVGPGSIVAVAAERKVETIVALLSITRAGGAYMPVDLSYPAARLQHMLSEVGARALLCHADRACEWRDIVAASPPTKSCNVDAIDCKRLLALSDAATAHPLKTADLRPHDLAAVLYTSGSTGQPKGVLLPQGALSQQQATMTANRGLCEADRVVQETILTFDVAGNEIWGCIHARATLVMVDDDTRLLAFEPFLRRHKISALFITPSHLGLLNPSATGDHLRMLVLAGEALPPALVDKWSTPRRAVMNEYGPTETNVVTTRLCAKGMASPSSIGRPLPGVKVRILDRHLQPTAVGVCGELVVSGGQLAAGYLKSPETTALKFVEVEGEQVYKTGDLCRWLPDGSIDFCGRVDLQVKIRGMRVETAEIESAILSLASQQVSQAAVMLHGSGGSQALVAFVVLAPASVGSWSSHRAQSELAQQLPQHMIPSVFEVREQLPTTSSGKVNRKQLMSTPLTQEVGGTGYEQPQEAVGTVGVSGGKAGAEVASVESYLASKEVKALQRLGVDSLGIARRYFTLLQDQQVAAWELQVADGIRALCMFGVIVDHLASCMPADVCQGFQRAVAIPRSRSGVAEPDAFAISAEILVRCIGNYKTIAGFVMTSAYMDAGTGPEALRFRISDAVILFVCLEMAWIFDPIATAAAGAGGLDTSQPWWLSNHRWYLLAMLYCRLAVVVLHGFRVPKLAQVISAACALFLLPANMVCLSAACSGRFINWGAAGQPWQALFTFFYFGTEPQRSDFAYPAFHYFITRKYLLCVFLYLLAFHYGRPGIRQALNMAQDMRSAIGRTRWLPKAARHYLPRLLYGTASASGLLALSLYQANHFEALEDNWVMEDGAHHSQATLPHLGLLVAYLVAQVCLMAGFVSALPPVLHWVGSKTLGSYVCHSYVNLVVNVSILDNPNVVLSTAAWLAIVLLVPAVTQVAIGPIVQAALLAHLHLVARIAAQAGQLLCCSGGKEGPDEDGVAGNALQIPNSTIAADPQQHGRSTTVPVSSPRSHAHAPSLQTA